MNRRDLLTCHLAESKGQSAGSPGARFYTNAVFHTHEGTKVRMYEDLIKGKIAVINFFYASCHAFCPRTMACLAKVQDLIGDKLGREIFMYSFTLKPEEDTPEMLRAYRKGIGAKPGWTFLTGSEYDLTTIRFKLLRMDNPYVDFSVDIHAGELRVINDNLNKWTSWWMPVRPSMIREVISWVEPTPPMAERVSRNAMKQRQLNEELAKLEPGRVAYKRAHGYPISTTKQENPEGVKRLEALWATVSAAQAQAT
jgi:protein SCO1